MKRKTNYLLISILFFTLSFSSFAQQSQLLIRLDDVGMCHGANRGAEKIFKTGIPISASVMTPCPWFEEAVEIIKKYPNVSVGIHLTLNAEWDNYKWGPVLGQHKVPSLVVDSTGYFPHNSTWFWKDSFQLDEIEREFRAQIQKALDYGLQVDYIDNHMGAGMMTDEQRAVCEKLAKEFGLGISGYYQEGRTGGVEGYYKKSKMKDFIYTLDELENDKLYLMVNHPGSDTPEMRALVVEMNKKQGSLAKQRNQVAETISSDTFINKVKENNIRLVSYKILNKEMGVQNTRPDKK